MRAATRAVPRPALGRGIIKAALLAAATLLTADLHGEPPPGGWVIPPPPAPYKPLVPPAQPIVATDAPSAYLPGAGSVAPTGEYRYRIPIQVPPGPAGMQPDLALTYSSRAGDGLVGVGWSISGLSEIHRCAKTFAIDGASAGVDYDDATDAICIDGNRLIWTGRGREEGTDYYVTEQETFARILSKSTISGRNVSRRFIVEAKDGRILEYHPILMHEYPEAGRSMDVVWPVAEVADRSGNKITYRYDPKLVEPVANEQPASLFAENASFSYAIEFIEYAYVGADARNTVSFEYEPRALPTRSWTKRIARVTDRQLRRVHVSTPSHPDLGHYTLEWALSAFTSRPLLDSIQRCSLQTCTQAKRFEYTDSPVEFWEEDYDDIAQPMVWSDGGAVHVGEVAVIDLDGNGLDDLVYPSGYGDPTFAHATVAAVQLFQPQNGSSAPERQEFLQQINLAPHVVVPVDAEGDGAGEVVLFPGTGTPLQGEFKQGFRLFRWDAATQMLSQDPAFPSVPFIKDGLPYAFALSQVYWWRESVVGQIPNFADLNGDGRADFVRSEFTLDGWTGELLDPRLMISRNAGGSFPAPQDAGNLGLFPEKLARRGARAIERHGEHRAALQATRDGGNATGGLAVTLLEADNGQLTFESNPRCEKISGPQHELKLDLNGDGLHDRLCVRAVEAGSDEAEACVNKGRGAWEACDKVTFVPPLPWNVDDPDVPAFTNFAVADLSGDGLDDIVVWRRGSDATILVYQAFPTAGGWAFALDAAFELPPKIQYVRLGDFNGDGRLDIAAIYDEATQPKLRLHLRKPSFVDELYEVREEGNARPSELVWYEPWAPESGWNDACDYPQRCVKRGEIQVVRAHRSLNPTVPVANAYDLSYATHYQYEEPRADYKGRGFLGFETVRSWDPQRPAQVTTDYRNNVYSTQPYRLAYPEAPLPARTRTVTPILDVPKDGRYNDPSLPTKARARVVEVQTDYWTVWTAGGSYWVHPLESVTKEWEEEVCIDWDGPGYFAGGSITCVDGPGEEALRERIETFDYDDYGNLEMHATETVGGTLSELVTSYDNRTSEWLLGLPTLRTEKSANGQASPWEARTTSFVHDAKGLLEKVEVEPQSSDPDLRLTVDYKRSAAGMVIGERRTAPGELPRHEYVHYDAGGIFPDVIWNDLGHARWATYDDGLGVPIVTLQNVQHTQWVHDGLGRTRHVLPDGAAKQSTAYALRADAAGQLVGMDVSTDGDAGDRQKVSTDELGRTIEQRHQGFDDNWIHRAIRYDVLGRVHYASRPAYGAPAAANTVYERDSLDRLTREIQPDNTELTQEHTFFETDTVDAEQRRHKVVRDVDGRVIRTVSYLHHDPGTPWETIEALPTKFTYGAFDLVETIEDPKQNAISIDYDQRGRRQWMDDPDAGASQTLYNGFGEARVHYNPLGVTQLEHDRAGRVVATDHTTDGITKYTWDQLPNDPSPNGMGQLAETVSPDGTKTRHTHDTHGRLIEAAWEIGAEQFGVSVEYDSVGRTATVRYPKVDAIGQVAIGYGYTGSNYLHEVRDTTNGAPGAPLWLVRARNADDALQQAHFGYDLFVNPSAVPALSVSRTHYDATGRLKTAVATKPSSSTPLYDMLYQYYDNGQVRQRIDSATHRTEVFDYDHLDRLTRWSLQGPKLGALRETDYAYDVIGNLTEVYVDGLLKTKNYYDGPRPHALELSDDTDLGTDDFDYDALGRQRLGGGRDTVEYTSFDLPALVVTPNGNTTFQYDAQHSRVKKETDSGTTISIGGLYERRGSGPGKYQHVFRVHGGEGPVAELVYDEADPNGKTTTRFIVADMLGSANLVTDGAGTVLERLFFEPFGQRIDAGGLPVAAAATTQHGFTDHWHDDELGLIDMRGRVYDPRSRRFLTPDPLVPNPLFAEAYNRYSYVYNNPLNRTDPSGFDPERGGGGAPPSGSGGGGHEGCGAGDCGLFGEGAQPVVLRSDAEGWQDFGCPKPAALWGSGPCPSGQVGGGCGGANPSQAEIHAALAAAIAHNNAVVAAGEPMRKQVEKWWTSGKSSREIDELMWQIAGGKGPAPPGYAVWGVNSWANAGHMIGVDQVATAAAIGSGVSAVNSWLGGGAFWRGLLANTKGGNGSWTNSPPAYSTAFEATLTPGRAGGTYAGHFAEANEQLLRAAVDPRLRQALRQSLGSGWETSVLSPSGRVLGTSPTGWTWHHVPARPGVLHLVPRGQHAPGSAWQSLLHPEGRGGMAEWGAQY